jgi:hypothetical protein
LKENGRRISRDLARLTVQSDDHEELHAVLMQDLEAITVPCAEDNDPESLEAAPQETRRRPRPWSTGAARLRIQQRLEAWRNVSPDGNPELTLKLRTMIPTTIICAIYIVSRAIFFVGDFSTRREQPVGVYLTVDRWMPFMGD